MSKCLILRIAFLERKSLEKMDQLIDHSEISLNSFIVPLAKGPANTMYVYVNN